MEWGDISPALPSKTVLSIQSLSDRCLKCQLQILEESPSFGLKSVTGTSHAMMRRTSAGLAVEMSLMNNFDSRCC